MMQGIVTAILLVAFVAGWVWVWSAKRKPHFDAAARLPLEDTDRSHGNEERP